MSQQHDDVPEPPGAAQPTVSATVTWRFRLPKDQIAYVRFIVEAYEGLAQVTSEPGRGEMVWIVPHACQALARQLAESLRQEVGLREVELLAVRSKPSSPGSDRV